MADFTSDMKVEMVSPDQMTEEERNNVFNNSEMSVDAIPDLDVLTGHVCDILEYLEKPETKKLMKTNSAAIKMQLFNKYADTRMPMGVITLLMEEEERYDNVEMLLSMFERLNQAKKGQITLEAAEKEHEKNVSERYLYSKYGSKEAFEQALAKEVAKERQEKQ